MIWMESQDGGKEAGQVRIRGEADTNASPVGGRAGTREVDAGGFKSVAAEAGDREWPLPFNGERGEVRRFAIRCTQQK